MAKFAVVGYGSDGRATGAKGTGYVYVVNDNVRTGDTIQPTVKHYKSGTIFGTTGVVLSKAGKIANLTTKESVGSEVVLDERTGEYKRVSSKVKVTDINGEKVGTILENDLKEKGIDPAYVATAAERGIKPIQGAGGKFVGGKSTYDANGNYVAGTIEKITRAENIYARQAQTGGQISKGEKTTEAQETWAEYAAKFIGRP